MNIFSFRISVTEHCHQATNLVFPRGFSSNMIYNVWAVFGGIMMYKVDKANNRDQYCQAPCLVPPRNFDTGIELLVSVESNTVSLYYISEPNIFRRC